MPERESAEVSDRDRSDLAGVAAGFANLLHAAGVSVAPDRAGRWATAVRLARPATTTELYWLGHVTLTLDRIEIAVYDAVFASVFGGLTDVADSRGDPNAAPIPRLDTVTDPGPARTSAVDGRSGGGRGHRRLAPRTIRSTTRRRVPSARPAPATADEVLRRRDFADCTPEELAQLRRIVSAMQVGRRCAQPSPPSPPPWPRRQPARHDAPRPAHRGHPFELRMRRPTERRRRVVLIADVSGSMEAYSRAYLYLLHGSVKALRRDLRVRDEVDPPHARAGSAPPIPSVVLRTAVADIETGRAGHESAHRCATSTTVGDAADWPVAP